VHGSGNDRNGTKRGEERSRDREQNKGRALRRKGDGERERGGAEAGREGWD
jgi:hypothetical protein